MLHEILQESWVYQDVRREGKQEALQESILKLINAFFPGLLPQAREALARKASLDQLDDTLDKLFQVRTQQDAAIVLQQHGQQP